MPSTSSTSTGSSSSFRSLRLPPSVRSALNTALPEMFQTSRPSLRRTAAGDPGDTDDHVRHEVAGRHDRSFRQVDWGRRRRAAESPEPGLILPGPARACSCRDAAVGSPERAAAQPARGEGNDGAGVRAHDRGRSRPRGRRAGPGAHARARRAASRRRAGRRGRRTTTSAREAGLRLGGDDGRQGAGGARLPRDGRERHEVQPLARPDQRATARAASATRGATPSSPGASSNSDNADAGPKTASCPAGVKWFSDRGRFGQTPHVGDLVYYGPGGGTHVELVVGVRRPRS